MNRIYCFFTLAFYTFCLSATVWGQLSVVNNTTQTIDFSSTVPGVSNGAYTGAGFQANPTAGRLDSDAWAVTGWTDGDLVFGGSRTTANTDYRRGAVNTAQTTGGFYAYTGSPGSAANPSFLIQPGTNDFAPGTITLRIKNDSVTDTITELAVNYNIFVRNDQARSSSFNFSYSSDNSTYTSVVALNYTTTQAADALGYVQVGSSPSRSTTISGLNIAPGEFFYIRWRSADVGGSNNRDEIALDDINLTATLAALPLITVSESSLPQFGNTAVGDVSAAQTYTVTDANLTDSLTITAPTDFQVSISSNPNLFTSQLVLPASNGTRTIYVRFVPTGSGLKSGNVTNASSGAVSKDVFVFGTGATTFSGLVNVGTGETYTSLTNPGGLFEAINSGTVGGDTTASITSDLTDESGSIALNQWTETGAGGYYLTIKPSAASRVVSTPVAAGLFRLINLNGADRVIIDGSTGGGTDRSLTLTNNSTSNAFTSVVFIGSLGAGAGANNITVKNCIIRGGKKGSAGSASTRGIYAAAASGSFNGDDNDNLTLQNNQILRANVGVFVYGGANAASYADNLVIQGNTFGDTTTNSNSIGFKGMELGFINNANIIGNTIQNVNTSTSEAVNAHGINLTTDFINSSVAGNNITDIRYAGTQGYGGRGINIETGNTASNLTIANNFISDIKGDGWNSLDLDSIAGIRIHRNSVTNTPTGGINLYNNSVNLGSGDFGGHSGGTLSAALYIGADAAALDVRGNIFATNLDNTNITNDATYAIYSDAPDTAFTQINFNDYYASRAAGILGFLGSDQTTIGAWRTATGKDAQSTAGNPLFESSTNLHITDGASAASNASAPLAAITTDIDGQTRSATTPDIGADEFTVTGIIVAGSALNFPNTTVGSTSAEQSYTVSGIGLTDDILVASPSTDFQISTTTGTGFGASVTLAQTGGTVAPTTIFVRFAPQSQGLKSGDITNASTGALTRTVAVSGFAATLLSGSIDVGTGQMYTSLTNPGGLFEAINMSILSDDVTVNLTSDLTDESGSVALNQWTETGAGNYTLTIKPGGAARSITSTTGAVHLINLNGADRVIFDGSLSGGADRSLTFRNVNTTDQLTDVFFIGSLGPNAGASNVTIKNCIVRAGRKGRLALNQITWGIVTGTSSGNLGADNDNLTIQNNEFLRATVGVQVYGDPNGGAIADNLIVQGNIFGDAASDGDSIGFKAIDLAFASNASISGNTIQNVSIDSSDSAPVFGILLNQGSVNSSVTGNNITNVRYPGSIGWGGKGIYLNTGDPTSNLTVANNFVSDIKGDGWNTFTDTTVGIGIYGATGGVRIYDNSVNLGSGDFAGNASGTLSAALYVGANATALDVRGNIFASNLDNTSTSDDKAYAVYSDAPDTAFTQINFNDYYASGAVGVLGFLIGDRTNIGSWQTATGQDAQSTEGNPFFTSATDLHITDSMSAASNTGTTIPGITTDFDGDLRDAATPDIGADEFAGMVVIVPTVTVAGGALNFPNTFAGDTSAELSYTVSGANLTADIIVTAPSANFQVSTTSGNDFGASVTLTQTGGTVAPTTIFVRFTPQSQGLKSGNITNASSDATTKNVAVSGLAPIVLSGSLNVGAGQTFGSLTNPGGLFEAINAGTVSGNLTVNITSNLTEESGNVFLNQWAETGAGGYTLTIKPSGAARSISSLPDAFNIIQFNGADRVVIDGSLNGGTDRSLTFTTTYTGTANNSVFYVASLGPNAGASNVTIKNCIIRASSKGSFANAPAIPVTWGIFVANAFGNYAGEDNDNLTIQNNLFLRATFGIQMYGGETAATYSDNLIVQGNTFGDAVTDSNSIGFKAMELGNINNGNVSGNVIQNINSVNNEGASPVAITLGSGFINSSVTGNAITSVRRVGTSGSFGSKGISIQTDNANSNVTIANNFISDLRGRSRNDFVDGIIGISINNTTGGVKIYHNSVNLGSGDFTGANNATRSAALYVATGTNALDIRGNIFATNLNNTASTTDKTYAIYSEAANSAFTAINYNDYYVTGTAGMLGFLDTDQTTIGAWRTATGKDAQSIAGNPLFASATDLHITFGVSAASNAGTPLAGITTDIDGQTRSVTTPDIGADEDAAPTAAMVEISGRVILPEDIGLTNALVTLTDMQGNAQTIRSGKFGRFRFTGVAAGETYILSVTSKRYIFAPQIITVTEDITDLNFAPQ